MGTGSGLLLVAVCMCWGGWAAQAADNTSTVIDYTTNITVGPYYVGNPGTNNTLLIHNGGQVFNDFASGTPREAGLGYNTADSYNKATIAGGGLWQVTGAVFRVGRAGSFNTLIVTNGGVLRVYTNVLDALMVAGASTSGNNLLKVVGTGSLVVTEGGTMSIGRGFGSAVSNNQMVITDGGTVSNLNSALLSTFGCFIGGNSSGYAGPRNSVTVGGGAAESRWIVTGPAGSLNRIFVGDGPSLNTLTVTTNGLVEVLSSVAGTGIAVGNRNGATANELVVTNGGLVRTRDVNVGCNFGAGAGATGNVVRVTGAGSRLEAAGIVTIGNGATSSSNRLFVLDGGIMTAAGGVTVGSAASRQYATIARGGALTNLQFWVGDYADASFNEAVIADPASLLVATNAGNNSILVGGRAGNTFNSLTISNGARVVSGAEVWVGGRNVVSGGTGNVLRITGAGSILQVKPDGSGVLVAGNGPTAQSNRVEVLNGGVLEGNRLIAGGYSNGVGSANTISNAGGVFQFTTVSPTLTVNSNALGNAIVINGGAIAFRGVTNANVKGNWTGTQLTNITWFGDNAFRLNSASNSATVSQSYTFNTGTPTNYARLEMVNGTTLYRNGTVTIGGSGAVLFSNTTASIADSLIVNQGGTVAVVDSAVTISNCTLESGAVLEWATVAALSNSVNVTGTLTVNPNCAVHAAAFLQKTTQTEIVLFQSANPIVGSISGWTVDSEKFGVSLSPDRRQLRLVRPRSTIILVK
jgi:hypothetical protein